MIYSKNILSGYVILRGTAMIHVPMLLVMLFVPRYTGDTEGDGWECELGVEWLCGWRFGVPIPERDSLVFGGGWVWYWLAVTQHFLLSILHLSNTVSFGDCGSIAKMAIEGLKMLTILAQVLNFIIGMNLFGTAPPVSQMTQDERIIKLWLMVEILLTVSLLASNILGMCFKFRKWPDFGTISIELERDLKLDYLASEDPQLIISVLC